MWPSSDPRGDPTAIHNASSPPRKASGLQLGTVLGRARRTRVQARRYTNAARMRMKTRADVGSDHVCPTRCVCGDNGGF